MIVKPVMLLVVVSFIVPRGAWAEESKKALARGWTAGGNARAADEYETGVDRKTAHGGHASAVMRARTDKPTETLYLTQAIRADDYRGKRLRFSGFARTDGEARLRFWLEAWSEGGKFLFGDAMQNRPVLGTTAWARYEIVIDIPSDAVRLTFGTAFLGKGAAWVDDFTLEVVDNSVPTTAALPPRQPVNLDFED